MLYVDLVSPLTGNLQYQGRRSIFRIGGGGGGGGGGARVRKISTFLRAMSQYKTLRAAKLKILYV